MGPVLDDSETETPNLSFSSRLGDKNYNCQHWQFALLENEKTRSQHQLPYCDHTRVQALPSTWRPRNEIVKRQKPMAK
jgi:hypothetical protein